MVSPFRVEQTGPRNGNVGQALLPPCPAQQRRALGDRERVEIPRPEQRGGHPRAGSLSAGAGGIAAGSTSMGSCAAERGSTSPITAASA